MAYEVFQKERARHVKVIRRPAKSDAEKKEVESSRVDRPANRDRKRKASQTLLLTRAPTKPSKPYNKKRKLPEVPEVQVEPPVPVPALVEEVQVAALDLSTSGGKEDDELSLIAPSTYSVESSDVAYTPTRKPRHEVKLKGMALNQAQRVILNVGGVRFETSAPTLESDPSSILASMVKKTSPFQPYEVDHVYTYFLDRDHKHFRVILNYLRNPNGQVRLLPVTRYHQVLLNFTFLLFRYGFFSPISCQVLS